MSDHPEIKNTPADKVSLGGKPPNLSNNNADLQNPRNIMRRDMIKEEIYAIKMEPGNSQISLKELLLYYLAFLYKIFDSKKESDCLLKAIERLKEKGAYSARELIALEDNDEIATSKDFSWMLGIVYLRLAIPEFRSALFDVRDREGTNSVIAHFLKKFEEKYGDIELKSLLEDLLKYDDDERLELEDLRERLERMYDKIFKVNLIF